MQRSLNKITKKIINLRAVLIKMSFFIRNFLIFIRAETELEIRL
jgi:hypothetical protein